MHQHYAQWTYKYTVKTVAITSYSIQINEEDRSDQAKYLGEATARHAVVAAGTSMSCTQHKITPMLSLIESNVEDTG